MVQNQLNPVIPVSVENIILKATAKNPKNRYKDVREMKEDIKTCLDEERENEEKIEFKYPETDFSDTRTVVKKEEKKTAKVEEPVVKQITEEDTIEKSNKKKTIIIASIIGVCLLAFILVIIVIPKLSSEKEVKVPDVYGMEISKAEAMLKKNGFKIDSKKKASDEVDEDLVIETEPSKNRYVKKGTTIVIYYSSGAKKTEIEDYTGQNAYEVKARLELLGLNVTIEEKEVENSSEYKNKSQLIIDQSVKKGEKLSSGENITLYIPKILSVYPDMVTDWEKDG